MLKYLATSPLKYVETNPKLVLKPQAICRIFELRYQTPCSRTWSPYTQAEGAGARRREAWKMTEWTLSHPCTFVFSVAVWESMVINEQSTFLLTAAADYLPIGVRLQWPCSPLLHPVFWFLFCFAESVNVGMTNCLAGLILSLCGICLYQNALA